MTAPSLMTAIAAPGESGLSHVVNNASTFLVSGSPPFCACAAMVRQQPRSNTIRKVFVRIGVLRRLQLFVKYVFTNRLVLFGNQGFDGWKASVRLPSNAARALAL